MSNGVDISIIASQQMQDALGLSSGARYYLCALQINPYSYIQRHKKKSPYGSEDEYNEAIVQSCIELGIEVIGVTDHYRVRDSERLVNAARNAGLRAFSGFEAVSKEGAHFICLFDSEKDEFLERFVGECGIYSDEQESPTRNLDSLELLRRSEEWDAVCVAVHVASSGGLLSVLDGQTRINVWKSQYLLACALPGPVENAPDDVRPILENKNRHYKRTRPPAIINAADVSDPYHLKDNRSTCFLKMSNVSVDGLRQAYLDPESRVRLHTDATPPPHAEFVAMTWEGGFIDGLSVHFNENLNILLGGRGTGKSTIIESIRYVLALEPTGEDAINIHEGIVRNVLRSGTKVSLLLKSHEPGERLYLIERSIPNPAVVKSENGDILELSPADIINGVEVFGQHEISEIAKDEVKRTKLLGRFVDQKTDTSGTRQKIRLELEKSRRRIEDVQTEIASIVEQLDALPGLEEVHSRFEQTGVEERLKEKSALIREERIFGEFDNRLESIRAINNELLDEIPVDTAFLSPKALEGLPNHDILVQTMEILTSLSSKLKVVADSIDDALKEADRSIEGAKLKWNERKAQIERNYESILRELQKSNIDGEEFIRISNRMEELHELKKKRRRLVAELNAHEKHRRELLMEWEDVKTSEFRKLERAAKKVSNKLRNQVKVTVDMGGNRRPFNELLREIGGNLFAALDRLSGVDDLSLMEFADTCRNGKEAQAVRPFDAQCKYSRSR